MIKEIFMSVLAGLACGVFNGLISRFSLKLVLNKSDKIFYSVWAAGFFYRLLFLVAAVWLLKNKNYIILISFAFALIFSQFAFEVIPLKKDHGFKRNTPASHN
ncbi:MAG: hypothetical protein HY746_08220 [Elusimicrobia bacterium]|nr:hypothetical protein [Elusimicrobiota bacterium]